jgi:hypothetical protein
MVCITTHDVIEVTACYLICLLPVYGNTLFNT